MTEKENHLPNLTGYRKAGVSADSAFGNVKRWLLWKEMDGSCSGLQFKLRMARTKQQQRRKRAPFMVSVRLSRRDWKESLSSLQRN